MSYFSDKDRCYWVELRPAPIRCHRLVMTDGLCLRHYHLWRNLEIERLRHEDKSWDDDIETKFEAPSVYRRNIDREFRELERQASGGDIDAQARLLASYLHTGKIESNRVRLAASLGHPIAQQMGLPAYGVTEHGIDRTWFRLNHYPYIKPVVQIINKISRDIDDLLGNAPHSNLSNWIDAWTTSIPNLQRNDNEFLANFCRNMDISSGLHHTLSAMAIFHGIRDYPHRVGDICNRRIREIVLNIDTFETLVNLLAHTSMQRLGGFHKFYRNRYIAMLLNHAVLPEFPMPVPPIGKVERCYECGGYHLIDGGWPEQVPPGTPECEDCGATEGLHDPCIGTSVVLNRDGVCVSCEAARIEYRNRGYSE